MPDVEDWREIYAFKCPHGLIMLIGESSYWCHECNDWLDGEEVGNVTAVLKDNGDIKVSGSGYYERQ